MADIDEIVEELKQTRDEIRVKINLASKEVKDEWEELEEKMDDFSSKAKQFAKDAELKKTGAGLGDALSQVGSELKHGYDRIREALRD